MESIAKRVFRGSTNFHAVCGHGGIVPQAQSVFGKEDLGFRTAGGGLASPQGTYNQKGGIKTKSVHYLTV
jgi:hypothetical protein